MSAPFSAEAFVEEAVAVTGLDDFGPGAWRDGLDRFVDALNGDAALNDIGVSVHQSRIAHLLAERLRVVDCLTQHPEIRDETIAAPVIVMGLPRTGTTALAHLLAADLDTRSLRTWEASAPTPPPEKATEATDPRIAATQAGVDMSHQFMPDLARLYFATATSPSETLDLTGMSFRAFQFEGQAHVPAFVDWLLTCDMQPAFEFQRAVHQLLQWHCPPVRWAWKNPPDVFWLREVRRSFPDARFIWTHREPFASLASVCSLVDAVRSFGTEAYDRASLGPRQTDIWAQGIDRGMAARDELGDDMFVDVWMDELVRDPIGTVAAIYERLGWDLTGEAERAMAAWQHDNPQHGRGAHDPRAADYGLEPGAVRERFSAYTERFTSPGPT